MRIVVTAGPTREYIDDVRFLSNASSGRMGFAVAAAAVDAGHEVTLIAGPVELPPPGGCRVVRFVSAADLKAALDEHFPACDALVMAAAVGDFRPARRQAGKMSRRGGCVTLELVPVDDLLASLGARKRPGQLIVAFAVQTGPRGRAENAAREKMAAKGADYIVVNAPEAMAAARSAACILSPRGTTLAWAERPKDALAGEIIRLLEADACSTT